MKVYLIKSSFNNIEFIYLDQERALAKKIELENIEEEKFQKEKRYYDRVSYEIIEMEVSK